MWCTRSPGVAVAGSDAGVVGARQVVRTAHQVGIRTSSTIMFGHLDSFGAWARHLLHLRALQAETGGFTEFVPLPFVHMQTPVYLAGAAPLPRRLLRPPP